MTRFLAISAALAATVLSAVAQAPRAQPVDPALRPDPGNDYFQRAKNLYDDARRQPTQAQKTARYEQVIPLLEGYIEHYPNHPNTEAATYFLGQALYQTGRVDDGKRNFHAVINRFLKGPYVAAAASALAVDHYSKREFALAATLFERSAANADQPADQQRALYYRALCLHESGLAAEALDAYKRVLAVQAGPTLFVARSQLAIAHLLGRAGKGEEALAAFELLVKAADDPAIRGEAALYAGITAGKLGHHDASDTHLRLVLNTQGMEQWRPEAQIALMSNRYDQKQYKDVIDLFERSPVKSEGIKEGRRLMLAGLAHMKLGNHAKALDLFRQIEREVPPDSDLALEAAYNRLLSFYQIDGEHVGEQADAFLQIYAKGRPKDPKIHTAMLMKAETMSARKQYREAAETYNNIDPTLISEANRPGFLFQRGWCLAIAGDSQGAIRSLGKFIEDFPKDPRVPQALAKRGETALADGDRAAALRDFDRLIALNPSQDLAAFAWQQSARLKKEEGDLDGMIGRYKSLLEKVHGLDNEALANANYWIGWGHAKSDRPRDAVPFLRKARDLDPKTYGRPATLQLAVGLFTLQDGNELAAEIDIAIRDQYARQIPEQALRWAGIQMYNAGRFPEAARFLELSANPDEPRETPKVVWRYLGKSRLESGDAAKALIAVEHVLEAEQDPAWKADALLDQTRCLLRLNRPQDARKTGEECLQLHPQGRTGAGIRLALGDAASALNDLPGAAAHYVVVANFIDDKELKPLALWKLKTTLEKQKDAAEARRYEEILKKDFPDFKVPE